MDRGEIYNMELWKCLMKIGHFCGCHQMSERSFFVRGYQFPVCARCTGVYLGGVLGLVLYWFIKPNIFLSIVFCIIMFLDWELQYKEILKSTNIRRVITGTLAGYGLISIEMCMIIKLIELIKNM